jgi:hypothetical protein
MSTSPTPAVHPAIARLHKAAQHLDQAADRCREAAGHHARSEHQTAAEMAKGVKGHVREAEVFLLDAVRQQQAYATSESTDGQGD